MSTVFEVSIGFSTTVLLLNHNFLNIFLYIYITKFKNKKNILKINLTKRRLLMILYY